MPEPLSANLLAARELVATLAAQRDPALKQASAVLPDINQLRATVPGQQGVGTVQGSDAARAELETGRARRRELLGSANAVSRNIVGIIDAIALDDLRAESDVPIALLPVRVETRSTAGGAQLRV